MKTAGLAWFGRTSEAGHLDKKHLGMWELPSDLLSKQHVMYNICYIFVKIDMHAYMNVREGFWCRLFARGPVSTSSLFVLWRDRNSSNTLSWPRCEGQRLENMTKEAGIECRLYSGKLAAFVTSYLESLECIEVIRSSSNFDMASEQVLYQPKS